MNATVFEGLEQLMLAKQAAKQGKAALLNLSGVIYPVKPTSTALGAVMFMLSQLQRRTRKPGLKVLLEGNPGITRSYQGDLVSLNMLDGTTAQAPYQNLVLSL